MMMMMMIIIIIIIIIISNDHVMKLVDTSPEGKVTILWTEKVHTDRTIANNIPDIIIRDNDKEYSC
jgi:hypothetical protein